jgi:hypothetical protein
MVIRDSFSQSPHHGKASEMLEPQTRRPPTHSFTLRRRVAYDCCIDERVVRAGNRKFRHHPKRCAQNVLIDVVAAAASAAAPSGVGPCCTPIQRCELQKDEGIPVFKLLLLYDVSLFCSCCAPSPHAVRLGCVEWGGGL